MMLTVHGNVQCVCVCVCMRIMKFRGARQLTNSNIILFTCYIGMTEKKVTQCLILIAHHFFSETKLHFKRKKQS